MSTLRTMSLIIVICSGSRKLSTWKAFKSRLMGGWTYNNVFSYISRFVSGVGFPMSWLDKARTSTHVTLSKCLKVAYTYICMVTFFKCPNLHCPYNYCKTCFFVHIFWVHSLLVLYPPCVKLPHQLITVPYQNSHQKIENDSFRMNSRTQSEHLRLGFMSRYYFTSLSLITSLLNIMICSS